jgi:hypothetical protein
VHVDRHYASPAQVGEGGAVGVGSRSGKPTQVGMNRHRDHLERALRGSPRVYRTRKGGCVARKKRKKVAAFVPARKRESGFGCPYVGYAVAEVARRRLVSNTLANGAPKRATAGVNGDLVRGNRLR